MFLNITADAVTHVNANVEERKRLRTTRRGRKTPCRKNRKNRARGGIPSSTKARWQAKLRIAVILCSLFPLEAIGIEDMAARTLPGKCRHWNAAFSPLEVGKQWAYAEFKKLTRLHLQQGYDTAEQRKLAGLRKCKDNLAETFDAHCVDAYCLARAALGLPTGAPDNTSLLRMAAIRLQRRNLHRSHPGKGGVRAPYGGTKSLG